jgi:hypothetical protein
MDLQINTETRANELEREVLKLQARVKELEKALSGRYRFLENEKLKQENELLRGALEFYANKDNWDGYDDEDRPLLKYHKLGNEIAKAALAAGTQEGEVK